MLMRRHCHAACRTQDAKPPDDFLQAGGKVIMRRI